MSIAYAVAKTGNTFTASYKAAGPTLGLFTYNQKRIFMSFDLPGAGVTGGVIAAQLIMRCTVIVGGGCPCRLSSAQDAAGWGTTLDATHDDWASTQTHIEDVVFVGSTGFFTWNVNPDNLSYTGRTFFSVIDEDEGIVAAYQTSATFNNLEAGTPSNRPVLRLTLARGQVIFINQSGVV